MLEGFHREENVMCCALVHIHIKNKKNVVQTQYLSIDITLNYLSPWPLPYPTSYPILNQALALIRALTMQSNICTCLPNLFDKTSNL